MKKVKENVKMQKKIKTKHNAFATIKDSVTGITIITLVVTIIVLLILAGVTIATLTGDNGILNQANKAKETTEIGEEKEIIGLSVIQATNNNGTINEDELQKALNENSKEGNKASIIASDIETFTVKFESNRYYEVNKGGSIEYIENVTGEKILTVQCVNSKNEVLGEYKYLVLTDRYSKLPPSVNKYESSEEKIEGELKEDKTIQVLYYLICNDDTTLVFTGLDSNGNVTTNDDEIVSYMIGDGVGSRGGCGLVSNPTYKAIVIIPSEYNNKSVNVLGQRAFQSVSNIVGVKLSNNITTIQAYALGGNMSFTEIILPENLKSMTWAFFANTKLKKVTFTGISGYANGNSALNAFTGCTNFSEIAIEDNNTDYKIIDGILYSFDEATILKVPNAITGDVIIKNSVTKIERWAFNQCGINSVTFGKNIINIGDRAFQSCSKLDTITIDSPNIAKITDTTNFGWLLSNTSVETIYIDRDIVTIGSYITENFKVEETTDKEGYIKYVKNT